MTNQIKTTLLLGLLTGLFVLVGFALGGRSGMIIALVAAVAMNFFSYYYSDRIVLKMYKAHPIDQSQSPEIYRMVGELASNAGLPMPRVYLIDDDTPNAFATGRNPEHGVVAVTSGIVRLLSPRELRGVLAHELTHIKNRDILVGSVAATLAGAVMVLANIARFSAIFGGGGDSNRGGGIGLIGVLIGAVLAPIGAMLIQMAVSRSREYMADRGGATVSGDPRALAGALGKLANANHRHPMAKARPETAHIFTVSPLGGRGMASLFSTHPPIEERIARLNAMGDAGMGGGYAAEPAYEAPQINVSVPPPPPPSGGRTGGKIDWS